MRTLLVVTHAEARHHRDGVVGGWFDSSLTDRGHGAAGCIAAELRRRIPETDPVELFSSDLTRARQTAEPISEVFGTPVLFVPGLREMSYGEAEGRPQAWLAERYVPAPADGDRMNHDHGVQGAETKGAFASRVYASVEEIIHRQSRWQVVVTHGGALSMVVACWIGMPLESAGRINVRSSSGSITELDEDDHWNNRRIVQLNDVTHLADVSA